MTRNIKAREIKPGMSISWNTCASVDHTRAVVCGIEVEHGGRFDVFSPDTEVTVLAEPQPKEPTTFGARVAVCMDLFLRTGTASRSWKNKWTHAMYDWGELCSLGPVTVIDADPSWTTPEDTPEAPEVPERITTVNEWPDDDTPLRAHKWAAHGPSADPGDTWKYTDGAWAWYNTKWGLNTNTTWTRPAIADFPLTRIN